MNKPYIEYEGKKYEFQASWSLRREYNRTTQEVLLKSKQNLNEDDTKNIEEIMKYVEKNPELSQKDILDMPNEIKEKMADTYEKLVSLDLTSVYEEFCFRMLKETYGIDKQTFEKMLVQFSDDYGMQYVDVLLQKACEQVFTPAVEKPKKPLPEWMN